jgi:cytochrome o ubiquinol oxidase subunit 2
MLQGTTGPRPRRIARLAPLSGALALGACQAELLDPAGPVAAGEKLILIDAVAVMLVIIVPVMVATLAFAWWYRASNTRARRLPDWSYSGRVELVVWSIPVLVVMFLGGMTWVSSHELDPSASLRGSAKAVDVQVVSLDWKWLFIYPDQGVASVNHLVIPVGAPVRFRLTSASVMTAFFIPRLGSMIYTMNGMVTPLNLRADRIGDYDGEASHFSGDGFPDMRFTASAVPVTAFDAWVAGARGHGPTLDTATYTAFGAAKRPCRTDHLRGNSAGPVRRHRDASVAAGAWSSGPGRRLADPAQNAGSLTMFGRLSWGPFRSTNPFR